MNTSDLSIRQLAQLREQSNGRLDALITVRTMINEQYAEYVRMCFDGEMDRSEVQAMQMLTTGLKLSIEKEIKSESQNNYALTCSLADRPAA